MSSNIPWNRLWQTSGPRWSRQVQQHRAQQRQRGSEGEQGSVSFLRGRGRGWVGPASEPLEMGCDLVGNFRPTSNSLPIESCAGNQQNYRASTHWLGPRLHRVEDAKFKAFKANDESGAGGESKTTGHNISPGTFVRSLLVGFLSIFSRRSRRKEFDKASSIQQHLRAIRHAENLDRQTHFRRSQGKFLSSLCVL